MTGDPWDARTLEWSTSSPPPAYNFAFTPVVHDHDAWWYMKKHGYKRPLEGFIPIHMPKNTGTGVILGGLSVAFGFAMIWHIWWLAIVCLRGDHRRRRSPIPSTTTAITTFRPKRWSTLKPRAPRFLAAE